MRFLGVGEPLAEFTSRADSPSIFHRRAGGDTLNSAIYLSRLMPAGSVGYLSRLGDDAMSRWLRQVMADDGIEDFCETQEGARPGLSFISTDAQGERSFTYWRDQAPARRMLQDSSAATEILSSAETVFLSGITLAVLLPESRDQMFAVLRHRHRAGLATVLDTNYRPILWPDATTAAQVMGRAAALASLVLPSQDDMEAAFGCADAKASINRLTALTKAEIVLTTGGDAVLHRPGGQDRVDQYSLPPKVAATDTTGAGDSFNAGWIASRACGMTPADAIARAARLAGTVVQHPGAVIPREAMPDLTNSKDPA